MSGSPIRRLPARTGQTRLSLTKSGPAAMNRTVNVHEAKTHLSRLLDEVAAGAEVVIARAGKPVARLVPLKPVVREKKLGVLRGRIEVPEDFDEPLPAEILADFEG